VAPPLMVAFVFRGSRGLGGQTRATFLVTADQCCKSTLVAGGIGSECFLDPCNSGARWTRRINGGGNGGDGIITGPIVGGGGGVGVGLGYSNGRNGLANRVFVAAWGWRSHRDRESIGVGGAGGGLTVDKD